MAKSDWTSRYIELLYMFPSSHEWHISFMTDRLEVLCVGREIKSKGNLMSSWAITPEYIEYIYEERTESDTLSKIITKCIDGQERLLVDYEVGEGSRCTGCKTPVGYDQGIERCCAAEDLGRSHGQYKWCTQDCFDKTHKDDHPNLMTCYE